MRLEVDGDFSSSKKNNHINSKLFFIKDKVEYGDIDVKYLPAKKMWSDVLNK